VIDEDNSAVFRSVEFVILTHSFGFLFWLYLFLFCVFFVAPRPIALELEQQLHVSCIGGSIEAPIERFLQDGAISQNRMDGNAHHWRGRLRMYNAVHVFIAVSFSRFQGRTFQKIALIFCDSRFSAA
jgi:hypothetical protein